MAYMEVVGMVRDVALDTFGKDVGLVCWVSEAVSVCLNFLRSDN